MATREWAVIKLNRYGMNQKRTVRLLPAAEDADGDGALLLLDPSGKQKRRIEAKHLLGLDPTVGKADRVLTLRFLDVEKNGKEKARVFTFDDDEARAAFCVEAVHVNPRIDGALRHADARPCVCCVCVYSRAHRILLRVFRVLGVCARAWGCSENELVDARRPRGAAGVGQQPRRLG